MMIISFTEKNDGCYFFYFLKIMGVYYITNLCLGTFGDANISTATKKIKLSDSKMVEQHEWQRKFVDLNELKAVCDKNNIDISEFINSNDDLFLEEVGCSTMEMDPCYWSSFIRVKVCFCNDETKTIKTSCLICRKKDVRLMGELEREWECCQKGIIYYGQEEFVCEACTQKEL